MTKTTTTVRLVSAALILLTQIPLNGTAMSTDRTGSEVQPHLNLMPVPVSVKLGDGRLSVTPLFKVAITGSSDQRLERYVRRAIRRLEDRMAFRIDGGVGSDTAGATFIVESQTAAPSIPSLDTDESYSLEVSSQQSVLKAQTTVGAMRGIETFLQLLTSDRSGYYIPAVSIQDRPRFRWRGLLIDVGRHFEPVEVIKRNLDAMAAVKLNVFHWHLTDDQGFRPESKKYPELTREGSDGLFYTQEEMRDVIGYAANRGIRVIPEFDMPGHLTSLVVSHPELAAGPGPYSIERNAGVFDPALDPTNEKVYKFLDHFLGEMASLFPDAYMHIGGDENQGKQWDKNSKIQEFKKKKGIKDNAGLQAYFNQRLLKILQKHHKRMIGWDEILNPELPKDAVIQSWRGAASLAEAAVKGYDGILSAGYYIDLLEPASKHYLADPIPVDSTLTEQERQHVLGGEATMWGEYVGPETIDSRIWPRTAAIAERLWSQQSVKDVSDMYRRLAPISLRLEELGLTHKKNQDMMLRRLAGRDDIDDLRTLIDLAEPVTGYSRGKLKPSNTLSPLSNLVDIARADAEGARQFNTLIEELLADAPAYRASREKISHTLAAWATLQTRIQAAAENVPALSDAVALAANLAKSAGVAREALSFLSSDSAPPSGWLDREKAALKDAAAPNGAVVIAVIPAIQRLVEAVAKTGSERAESR